MMQVKWDIMIEYLLMHSTNDSLAQGIIDIKTTDGGPIFCKLFIHLTRKKNLTFYGYCIGEGHSIRCCSITSSRWAFEFV